jgi:3-oxoacyl-[acyl-carrier protein] reductase
MTDTTEDRVAVVTGGGRGIGAAIARRLADDGFRIAIFDLDRESAEQTSTNIASRGGTAVALAVDVSSSDSVTAGVGDVVAHFGPPTVLINNAGVTRDNLLFKMTDDDWDLVAGVHLRGAFLMTRAVQSHMVERKWGRIVNLSSTAALGNRGQLNYSTAKAGLQGFTKTAAIELGPFGVTVNAIAPGFIETDMTRVTAERMGVPFEEFVAGSSAAIPVRRVGQPADVAHLASFFVSEGAGFVSGQVVYLAGGPRA